MGSLLSTRLARVLPQVIFGLGLLAFLCPLFLPYFFEALPGQPLLLGLLGTLGRSFQAVLMFKGALQ